MRIFLQRGMKIRTITVGINLATPLRKSNIIKVARFCLKAKEIFEKTGIQVQSLRISTQPWGEYCGALNYKQTVKMMKNFEDISNENGIDFVSIGTVEDRRFIDLVPEIIQATSRISTSVVIADYKKGIDDTALNQTAQVVIDISKRTVRGYGNFRFAAISNCPPDIPFFPASYHRGRPCFAIALECSDLLMKAFSNAKDIIRAEDELRSIFEPEVKKIEKNARRIARQEKIMYKGIDVSPAPSLSKKESLAFAFERLNVGKFGAPGTLAVSGMITKVLKSLRVSRCGYSGLMFPILEDYGLAERYSEGFLDISTILACSSICGTGLDCVPLPGNISVRKIRSILLDIAALSIKLNKPLSARLFPVPGKQAGEMTDFKSPFLLDCKIQRIY